MSTILSVLSVAQDTFLGFEQKWYAQNEQQQTLVKQYLPKTHELNKLFPEELTSCASQDVAVVNKFLENHCFSIKLRPLNSEEGFGVASILRVALIWKTPGIKTTLFDIDQRNPVKPILPGGCVKKGYPAVLMKQGFKVVRTIKGQEILSLACENGDTVYMTKAENPRGGFELLEYIKLLEQQETVDVTKSYKNALFPMVDLRQQEDIHWLENLGYGRWYIDQAVQETHFAMDEKGARAESGVAIGVVPRCYDQRPVFCIDKAFYLWIKRPGMSILLFAGYLAKDVWKAPAQ